MKKATIIIALLICVGTAACSEQSDSNKSGSLTAPLTEKEKATRKKLFATDKIDKMIDDIDKKSSKATPNTF